MAEHDALGAEAFRERHGLEEAREYVLVHGGREYDSKAIAAVAYGLQHELEVTPSDFSGGERTVVKALERLGFDVTQSADDRPSGSSAAWDANEMVLALHWYLRYRAEAMRSDHAAVVALSTVLEQRAVAQERPEAARARRPHEVAAQISGFIALDPNGGSIDGGAPSRAHADTWARWARNGYARRRRVDELLGELHGASPPESRAAARRQLAEAWGMVETPQGYRPRAEPAAAEDSEPLAEPEELLSPYRGPRAVASRTAAEPRVEDPELYDRAHAAHEALRAALAWHLSIYGFGVYDASNTAKAHAIDFDLAADDSELYLVIAAKSMPAEPTAQAGRLRAGLGQLLWYRHRILAVSREARLAVLVVDREPGDAEEWLAVCRASGVVLTWPERFELLLDECRCARARG